MVRARTEKDKITAADMALLLAVSGAIASMLSGCGMTTGWQVQFGVNPISATQDVKVLNQREIATDGKFSILAR